MTIEERNAAASADHDAYEARTAHQPAEGGSAFVNGTFYAVRSTPITAAS